MRFSRAARRRAVVGVAAAAAAELLVTGYWDRGSGTHTGARGGVSTPATGASPSAAPVPPPGSARKPNIVFVLTDDLSTDLVQYMPHVQALAQRGTTFDHYFVTDSLCCPSRASILTGQYPHNTQVFYNTGPKGGWDQFQRVGDGKKVYGLSLQAAGYRTAFLGKYLNHYPPSAAPPAGWNQWDVTGSQGYAEFDYDLNQNGQVHHYGHAAKDYLTDVLDGRARHFIDSAAVGRQPFAIEVATYAPHAPSTPAPVDRNGFPALTAPRGPQWDRLPTAAPRWLARYRPLSHRDIASIDARYRLRVECVQAVDRMLGRLEAELIKTHQLSNTYFVFSSDNGFHMGQRRMLPGKQAPYDTDIRVPLIVAGPGVPAGRTDSTMVSTIDLAPTFDEIAGARPRAPADGTSMLALWHGRPAPAGWSRTVLVEHRSSTIKGDPDWQSSRSGAGPSYEAVRTPDYLYVEYVTGDREYYDLTQDPDELHNLYGQLPPARVRALHQLLTGLAGCHGATCRSRALATG